jgi:anti-sigma regulatory factor (Ser/Thr protein kinase)
MTHQTSSTYASDPATPGRARAWALAVIREALGPNAASMLLDDAALVISELMTNSLRAGSKSVTLTLTVDPGYLRVAVRDDVEAHPQLVNARPDDVSGRGLHIVSALASDWGSTNLTKGKEVWADLALIPVRPL